MTKEQKYLLFCIEVYKQHRRMTGAETYAKFKKYRFDEYILELYDLLHLNGTQSLLLELDEYQAAQDKAC